MLPHLADRPLTMIRMPEGIDGERFFQKHWAQALPEFVESVTVFSEHKDEKHRYLLANNVPTLLWLGQVGTLEFHVWHCARAAGAEAAGAQTDYASSLAALESSILTTPTTWCSTSTLTSTPARKRRARSRNSTARFRGRQARRVLAARAAETDVPGSDREDSGRPVCTCSCRSSVP